jgi:hypothetical protein
VVTKLDWSGVEYGRRPRAELHENLTRGHLKRYEEKVYIVLESNSGRRGQLAEFLPTFFELFGQLQLAG